MSCLENSCERRDIAVEIEEIGNTPPLVLAIRVGGILTVRVDALLLIQDDDNLTLRDRDVSVT